MSIKRQLAHSIGSKDPHIHITTIFRKKDGEIIKTPQRGNGELKRKTHVYADHEHPENGYKHLPIEYKKAIDKHAKKEGREPGHA